MPHWLIKAAVQRSISLLPQSHLWNEFFQKHVTRSIEFTPRRFEERLRFCGKHFDNFRKLSAAAGADFNALEVGTGWYPVVPVGLFLCGAREVWTYDIAPHLNRERLSVMVERLETYAGNGELQRVLPQALPERVARLKEALPHSRTEAPEAFLERLGIHVRIQDAQATGLTPGSVNLFVSTGVLEYIPRAVLKNILLESQRIARPGAVSSHYLNLVDQYSYFDSSITAFNFLKYSNRSWHYLNSPLTWQNRLRISDFRAVFAETGFPLQIEENTSGAVEDLKKIRLSPEFQHYKTEDLLVILSWIAARSQNPAPPGNTPNTVDGPANH